jgi:hypothetical protein
MADIHILKNTRRQAAVKVSGTGSATIDVASLAYSDQTITTANLELMLTDASFMTTANGNVIRNGNLILVMPAGSADTFNFTTDLGVNLNEKANTNVVVNLGGTEGVCILQFSKGAGYNDPNRQNQGPGSL